MKKFLVALVAVVALAFGADAQKADIMIGYGGYTQMDGSDCHDGWHGVKNAWGAVTLGVNFHITRNFSLGPSYSLSTTTTKGGPDHSSIAYHVLMLNGRYSYYRTSFMTLYAHLGLGCDISHMMPKHGDSYNCAYFAFQASPLCADFAIANRVSFFAELGYGAQGVLQAGFRFGI